MTATDELRRMLDERGVEWWQKKRHTCWKVGKGQEVEMWRAWEAHDGSLTLKVDYIYGLTPEQAIAATLGPVTCNVDVLNTGDCAGYECGETHLVERHLPWDDDDEYWLYCDECGYLLYMRKAFVRPRYCSHCGRKAVEE